MRLVFFGSGAFGLPSLRALAAGHDVAAVVTRPDRPAGRGGKLTPTPIGLWAAEHLRGRALIRAERVNDAAVVEEVRRRRADAFVVIAFGQKIGRALLEGAFAINLHASLLPRWRGAAPINAAILAGDSETGNSVIALADRMDAGTVFAQSRRPIDPTLTAGELHDVLAEEGPALLLEVLDGLLRDTLKGEEQDESRVTLAPKLTKADGWVDFGRPAEACRQRVHGLTPWPGVAVELQGEQVKLLRVQPAGAGGQGVAGGWLVDAAFGVVACGGGTLLRVLEVQPAGGRAMTWEEFVRGRRIEPGSRLVAKAGPVQSGERKRESGNPDKPGTEPQGT